MVFGLESVGNLDELWSATNQVREEFRKNFPFPLVLWVCVKSSFVKKEGLMHSLKRGAGGELRGEKTAPSR